MLWTRVEATPGESPTAVFQELLALANKLNIGVLCSMSGIDAMVPPNGNLDKCEGIW